MGKSDDDLASAAIGIQVGNPDREMPTERVIVNANQLTGPQHGILLLRADRCRVQNNRIASPGNPGFRMGIWAQDSGNCRTENNTISDIFVGIRASNGTANSLRGNHLNNSAYGIFCDAQRDLDIAHNRLVDLRRAGMALGRSSGELSVCSNEFNRCSNGRNRTALAPIVINGVNGHLMLQANRIIDTGIGDDGSPTGFVQYGAWAFMVRQAQIAGNHIGYTDPQRLDPALEHRALFLVGLEDSGKATYNLQLADNQFVGPGQTALVEIEQRRLSDNVFQRFGAVQINQNYFNHYQRAPHDGTSATVIVHGRDVTVQNNQFESLGQVPTANFAAAERVIYMGNIGTAPPINLTAGPNRIDEHNLH